MEDGHVEYDKRLNWIGLGVFGCLCLVWYTWLIVTGRFTDGGDITGHFMILGVSAAIGLFVHASWQLLLYPYAVYKIRRAQGDTALQACVYFLRFLVVSLILGVLGVFLFGLISSVVGKGWAAGALSVLAALCWDISRKRIRTVDVPRRSRDLTLK